MMIAIIGVDPFLILGQDYIGEGLDTGVECRGGTLVGGLGKAEKIIRNMW